MVRHTLNGQTLLQHFAEDEVECKGGSKGIRTFQMQSNMSYAKEI